jgi:hypothetical protein
MDDMQVIEEKPYKLEIVLNSNNESQEKNFLKMKIIIELKEDYPHSTPSIILRNLSQDIIDNNLMIHFEKLVTEKADESLGTQMLYDVCEALREKLSDMNEKILNKLDEINQKDSIENALKSVAYS